MDWEKSWDHNLQSTALARSGTKHPAGRFAWGADELAPLSRNRSTVFAYDAGITILDALDTLWLLGLTHEFDQGRAWVVAHLRLEEHEPPADVFTLGATFLGSLLGAHSLTNDPALLDKALRIANRMLPAFDTPHGLPWRHISLGGGNVSGESIPIGEAVIPTLELLHLARITGDVRFEAAAMRLWQHLDSHAGRASCWQGLLPVWWGVCNGSYVPGGPNSVDGPLGSWWTSLGGLADSAYEYMLKMWLLSGKQQVFLSLYTKAVRGIRTHLLRQTRLGRAWLPALGAKLLLEPDQDDPSVVDAVGGVHPHARRQRRRLASSTSGACGWESAAHIRSRGRHGRRGAGGATHLKHGSSMEHLACFAAGMLALGHIHGIDSASGDETAGDGGSSSDLQLAEQLAATCYQMYLQTPTGLSPHIVAGLDGQSGAGGLGPMGRVNDLQPETLESLFYLWRATHNSTYREWAWQIFRAFNMWSRVATGGFAGLKDATAWPDPQQADIQWRWWMAECLKYLWLIYSDDDVLPLDAWVLNTVAHALPVAPPGGRRPMPPATLSHRGATRQGVLRPSWL